jgi:hypothetical protein
MQCCEDSYSLLRKFKELGMVGPSCNSSYYKKDMMQKDCEFEATPGKKGKDKIKTKALAYPHV